VDQELANDLRRRAPWARVSSSSCSPFQAVTTVVMRRSIPDLFSDWG